MVIVKDLGIEGEGVHGGSEVVGDPIYHSSTTSERSRSTMQEDEMELEDVVEPNEYIYDDSLVSVSFRYNETIALPLISTPLMNYWNALLPLHRLKPKIATSIDPKINASQHPAYPHNCYGMLSSARIPSRARFRGCSSNNRPIIHGGQSRQGPQSAQHIAKIPATKARFVCPAENSTK